MATVPEKEKNIRGWRYEVVYDANGRFTRLVRKSTPTQSPGEPFMVAEAPVGMAYGEPNPQWATEEVAYTTVDGIPWER